MRVTSGKGDKKIKPPIIVDIDGGDIESGAVGAKTTSELVQYLLKTAATIDLADKRGAVRAKRLVSGIALGRQKTKSA